MITVDEADRLAEQAHGGDRTKSGLLFIEHVRRVAARVEPDPDPYAVPAALLHDTVEKSSMRWTDLRDAGADERLIAIVDALTERDDEPEVQYLARCAADPLALRIKRVDISDKLDIGPDAPVSPADRQRLHSRARNTASICSSGSPPQREPLTACPAGDSSHGQPPIIDQPGDDALAARSAIGSVSGDVAQRRDGLDLEPVEPRAPSPPGRSVPHDVIETTSQRTWHTGSMEHRSRFAVSADGCATHRRATDSSQRRGTDDRCWAGR